MVHLTFKKWLKITVTLMILSTIVLSMYALYIDKKAIEWDYVLFRSIGMPLIITGALWLWGDLNFKNKGNEEKKTNHED